MEIFAEKKNTHDIFGKLIFHLRFAYWPDTTICSSTKRQATDAEYEADIVNK